MATNPRETKRLLRETFQPVQLVVEGDSVKYTGYAGAAPGGRHYNVKIVNTAFTGENRLARHRMMYDALRTLRPAAVHALTIRAVIPERNA